MKRLTLLAALGFALVACEKKSAPNPAPASSPGNPAPSGAATGPATPAPGGDTFSIGEVSSLTGPEATFGTSTHHGIELALKEINAAGGVKGKKVALKTYDDQGKPEEAANAALRLVTQDHVQLVLGEVASTNSKQMAPACQNNKVPMITPASTNPEVTQIGDYIFRVCFIDPFQGTVMAKFAHDNLKMTKVAILKDVRSDYSMGLSKFFAETFTKLGGQIIKEASYSKGDVDYKAQLTQIKATQPEGIYVPGYYNDVGLIAQQARDLGITVPLMGGDGWDSAKLFEIGGRALEGCYHSNHYSTQDPNPRLQKFVAAYKAAYGEVPDALAALGYDAARVGVEAYARAQGGSNAELRDAIAQTKDFDGVTGKITLDANRNAVKPAVILKIENGKQVFQTAISP